MGSAFCAFPSSVFLDGESCILFMGPASTFFNKIFIKIESHGTIHTFKNYFIIVFSVFSNKWYSNTTILNRKDLVKITGSIIKNVGKINIAK